MPPPYTKAGLVWLFPLPWPMPMKLLSGELVGRKKSPAIPASP